MLDRGRAVPGGGAPLPLPSREPVVPAAPEATPADLDPGHREPGDGHLGRTPGLHLRAVPGAVRHRTRALRLLPPGRGRSGTYGDAGQPRLPHLRRHGRHHRQGGRGGEAFRLADGPDAPGAGRVVQGRFASKNSRSSALHSPARTPPTASTRWPWRPSSSRRWSDTTAPAFGSRAPYTTRATRAWTAAPQHIAHGSSVAYSSAPGSR